MRPRQQVDLTLDVAQRLGIAPVGASAGRGSGRAPRWLPGRARLCRSDCGCIAPSAVGSGITSVIGPLLQRPHRVGSSLFAFGLLGGSKLVIVGFLDPVSQDRHLPVRLNGVFWTLQASARSRCKPQISRMAVMGEANRLPSCPLRAFRGRSPRSSRPLLRRRRRSSPGRCLRVRHASGRPGTRRRCGRRGPKPPDPGRATAK